MRRLIVAGAQPPVLSQWQNEPLFVHIVPSGQSPPHEGNVSPHSFVRIVVVVTSGVVVVVGGTVVVVGGNVVVLFGTVVVAPFGHPVSGSYSTDPQNAVVLPCETTRP